MQRIVGFDGSVYNCLYVYDDNIKEVLSKDIADFCTFGEISFNRLLNGFNRIDIRDIDGVKIIYVSLRSIDEEVIIDYMFVVDSNYLEIVLGALKDVTNKEAKLNLLGIGSDKFDEIFNVFDYIDKKCSNLDIKIFKKEVTKGVSFAILMDKKYVLETFRNRDTLYFMKDFRNFCLQYYSMRYDENNFISSLIGNEITLNDVCSFPVYHNGSIIGVMSYIHDVMKAIKGSMVSLLSYCEKEDYFYVSLITVDSFIIDEVKSQICSAIYSVKTGEWSSCVLDEDKLSEMLKSGYLKEILYA